LTIVSFVSGTVSFSSGVLFCFEFFPVSEEAEEAALSARASFSLFFILIYFF